MNHFWLFVHLLGFTMWLGGGLAAMFIGIAAKAEDRSSLGARGRAQAGRDPRRDEARALHPGSCTGG